MSMIHSLGRKAKIKMKKPPCLAASEQTCCRLGELSSSMLIITFKTYNNFLIIFFFVFLKIAVLEANPVPCTSIPCNIRDAAWLSVAC